MAPRSWLDGVIASQRRFERLVDGVTDDVARRPSLLPGWTVGHLMTHVARNADSQLRMLRGAQAGEMVAQYPGGLEGRAADIEAGSGRSAAALVTDIVSTNAALEGAYASTTDAVWETGLGLMATGAKETVAELVFRRWREVEVHAVDLGLDHTWSDLDPSYVDVEWERTLAGLSRRLAPEHTVILVPGDRPSRAFGTGAQHVLIRAAPARILGWLLRGDGEGDWPELKPWG